MIQLYRDNPPNRPEGSKPNRTSHDSNLGLGLGMLLCVAFPLLLFAGGVARGQAHRKQPPPHSTARKPAKTSAQGGSPGKKTPARPAAHGAHGVPLHRAGANPRSRSRLPVARVRGSRSVRPAPGGKSYRPTYSPPPPEPELQRAPVATPEAALAEVPAAPFLDPKALAPFFRALAELQAHESSGAASGGLQASSPEENATVRALQFGDSHTAADLFSGELRARLQAHFGDGGLGFQYPGHPFAGYRLAGSSRSQTSGWFTEGNKFTQLGDGDLGLGGIGISTQRPGESISLSTTCTNMQVQYLRQPGGGRLRFSDNGVFVSNIDTSGAETGGEAAGASAAGSTGAGTMSYACIPGLHSFELTTLDRAPVRLLGLVTEQPGITYECLGINGAVAPLMLRWNQQIFADYLRQRDPNLIVLAYGTNEAASGPSHNEDYVYQFNRLIQTLHRVVPNAAVLVLGPYDRATRVGRGRHSSWQTYYGTDRIIADQKEACRLYGCAFYDERARMGGPGAMLRWASSGLAQPDHTHLTGAGYRVLADALYADLMSAYKTYQQTASPPS
jgi:lysophospholipase L1-like esterase